jgi:macrolide transport system ATP-binding/permease protein
MRWLRAWFLRLGASLGINRREKDFSAELENHLQLHIEDNLRAGLNPEEARRQALIKLGGVEQVKTEYGERQGLPLLELLFHDFRFALRLLKKDPGFTAIAILTLALGMGATTTIFSVVNSVLLRPLPYQNHDRLLRVQETHSGAPASGVTFSTFGLTYATFLDLEREAKTIENPAGRRPARREQSRGGPQLLPVAEPFRRGQTNPGAIAQSKRRAFHCDWRDAGRIRLSGSIGGLVSAGARKLFA